MFYVIIHIFQTLVPEIIFTIVDTKGALDFLTIKQLWMDALNCAQMNRNVSRLSIRANIASCLRTQCRKKLTTEAIYFALIKGVIVTRLSKTVDDILVYITDYRSKYVKLLTKIFIWICIR